jgi:LPS export ABC transporter permease LptF
MGKTGAHFIRGPAEFQRGSRKNHEKGAPARRRRTGRQVLRSCHPQRPAKDSAPVKLLDRYVGTQVLVTGLFAVVVLSVVLVLGRIFKELLDLLVNNAAPLDLILSIIGYILPFSLVFTVPWGFLTAVLLVFGKMSAENELVALRSSGVSITRICAPVFVISAGCVALCLWINVEVAPRAQLKMKDALYNIATSNPLAMFGSDKVIDAFPGHKIYIEHNEGAQLFNLLVYEISEGFDPMRVVFARRGLLETDAEKKQLLLHIYDGRLEQRDAASPEDLNKLIHGVVVQESTLPISLAKLYEKNQKKRGMSAMTTAELLERAEAGPVAGEKELTPRKKAAKKAAALTEVNKRFSFSFASFAFALIGVPLAITAHRKETSIGFLLSLVVAFVYFFFIIIADTLRDKPKAHPELLVWLPNVLFISIGAWLFYRLSRR